MPGAKLSLKNLISEMGFYEKLPEYKACVKFLEATKPKAKQKEEEAMETISSVSLADSPQKKQDMKVLVTNIHSKKIENTESDHKRDDLEEHQEKQQKEDQYDEEIQPEVRKYKETV